MKRKAEKIINIKKNKTMNKNDICINVAECTPEQRKEIVTILKGAEQKIYIEDRQELTDGKCDPIYNFLVWDDEEGFWMGYSDNDSRKILTFSEFQAFFQGEQTEGSIFDKIRQWGTDRNFYGEGGATIQIQFVKLAEEMGELAGNIARGKDCTDDIGDMSIVLTHIAELSGTTIEKCIEHSYNEIKDRKGRFVNGSFIKESDLSETERGDGAVKL